MNKTTENRLGGELRSQQTAQRLLEELRDGIYAAGSTAAPVSWSWLRHWGLAAPWCAMP